MRFLYNIFDTIIQGQYFQSITLGLIGTLLFILFYPVILAKFRIGFIHYFLDYAMAFYAYALHKHNNQKVYKKYQKKRYVFKSRVAVDLKQRVPKNELPPSKAPVRKSAGFLRLNFKSKADETLGDRFACFDERYYVKPSIIKSDLDGEASASRFLGYDIRGRSKEVEPDPFRPLYEHIGYTQAEPIFIKGAPGFGKSNLCRYISYFYRFEAKEIDFSEVFLVEAKTMFANIVEPEKLWPYQQCYLQSNKYRHPLLIKLALEDQQTPDVLWIRNKLKKRSLLVIDALDELETLEERERFLEEINLLYKHYPKLTIVVSGRHSSFQNWQDSVIDKSHFFEILPLSSSKLNALTMSVFSLLITEKNYVRRVEDFKRRINNSTTIEMASNPLLLTLMVLLDYSGKKKLPNSKPELIKMVIEESMARRVELAQLKQKEAFQDLLSLVSVCLNKGESIKNTRRKLTKKVESCCIEGVDDYSSLIALFEKVGLVFANSSGQLSFVHRCFNEYLYAKHLFESLDDSNADEMLKLAIEQEFSEVFFYYCSFHKNVSGLLEKLLEKGNSEIERCVEILAFEQINTSIKTSKSAMSLFRVRIKEIWRNDIELFSKVFLQYKLDMLRLSNPLASKPLKYREAASFFQLDKARHNRRNSLVGLSNKEVRELFTRINQTYSDYRGSFSLPTIRMMTSDSADDTVIRFKDHFKVYREKSKWFTRIKHKVEVHANRWYEKMQLSHEDAFRDASVAEKIKKMVSAVMKEWNPNILLLPEIVVRKANQKYVDEEFERRSYNLLRNELVGDTYQRAHQAVSSKIIKAIFGEGSYDEISKLYQQVYIMNSDQLLDFRRLTAEDIDPLIKGATVRFISSLQSSDVYTEFKKVSFLLSRLYTLSAILAGDVEPWGRLRIMFIAKVDGDEF